MIEAVKCPLCGQRLMDIKSKTIINLQELELITKCPKCKKVISIQGKNALVLPTGLYKQMNI